MKVDCKIVEKGDQKEEDGNIFVKNNIVISDENNLILVVLRSSLNDQDQYFFALPLTNINELNTQQAIQSQPFNKSEFHQFNGTITIKCKK